MMNILKKPKGDSCTPFEPPISATETTPKLYIAFLFVDNLSNGAIGKSMCCVVHA